MARRCKQVAREVARITSSGQDATTIVYALEEYGRQVAPWAEDVMLKMEDNYAQINCITTFFWCSLLGLLFSAIIARPGSRKNNVFTDEEMKQNNDDEFNF